LAKVCILTELQLSELAQRKSRSEMTQCLSTTCATWYWYVAQKLLHRLLFTHDSNTGRYCWARISYRDSVRRSTESSPGEI